MATPEQRRLLYRLKRSEYAYLRDLDDVDLVEISDIDAAIDEVVVDRVRLADGYLSQALAASLTTEVEQRLVISHSYYAQYHTARALILHVHRFDCDYHEQLPIEVEKTLDQAHAKTLIFWRDRRNEATYNPYLDFDLAPVAASAPAAAEQFVTDCKDLLRKRGVSI